MISISKRIILFLNRQIFDLKQKGISEFLRKFVVLFRKLLIVLLTILSFPVIIIIKLFRPLKKIRFGWFFGSRIGHFAFDVEYYLVNKYLESKNNTLDLFFYRWGRPANSFFAKLIEKKIIIKWWVEPLYYAHRILFKNAFTIQPAIIENESRDLNCVFSKVKPQLGFSQTDQKIGKAFLDKIGVKSEKIICMIVRDSAYLKFAEYHNYRDCNIENFNKAALFLAEKGYYVFRMGKKMNNPLTINHPRIIDYAFDENKSDFLDIWIMANCFFCISTGTGLDEIARIFRKPAVYLNIVPFTNMVSYDNIISVPSILKWKDNGEMLSLTQCLNHNYYFVDEYFNAGIEIEKLKPWDICNTVLEKEARLNGTWQESNEDKLLQEEFWRIFKSHQNFKKYHGKIHPEARVGAHFLRSNPEWLN